MDAFATYTVATSGWLAVQAIPLLFTPSVLLPLLTTEDSPASVFTLSVYLARSLAITKLFFAILSILLSGLIPMSSPSGDGNSAAAYAGPVTVFTTMFHFFTAFHAYTEYAASGLTVYSMGLVGSASLAAFGTWVSLFGMDSGHVSRRTGKDKRVSGWPFGDRKGRATNLKDN